MSWLGLGKNSREPKTKPKTPRTKLKEAELKNWF
jgi:hypothetical protein